VVVVVVMLVDVVDGVVAVVVGANILQLQRNEVV